VNIFGKKFVFATIAIICVSAVAVLLKYEGDIYLKLVGAVVGIFLVGQTVHDSIKAKNGNNGPSN